MTDAPKRRTPRKAAEAVSLRLTAHELGGLYAEAFEAYDMQDERIRFDTLGRRWAFAPTVRENRTHLQLALKRGELEAEDHIETPILASAMGRGMIEACINALDGAVA